MTKKSRSEFKGRMEAKTGNSFIHVPFSARDLGQVERGGGGGGTLFTNVDANYRQSLVQSVEDALKSLEAEHTQYPYAPSVFSIKLREKAVAKSHRPLKLADEANLVSAGHAGIDEMLVSVTQASVQDLKKVILNRKTKAIEANLSAIENVYAWNREKRNPEGIKALLDRGSAIIRLFQYNNHDFNTNNYSGIIEVLHRLGIKNDQFSRSKGLPLFAIKDIQNLDIEKLNHLLMYPGMRMIFAEPIYAPTSSIQPSNGYDSKKSVLPVMSMPPTVAVFDTGVSDSASAIKGWVQSKDVYILPPDTNYEHGTAVASLVSGAVHFNPSHPWIPSNQSLVHDVVALDSAGSLLTDLEVRLTEAVKKRPDIKIWNLSLGASPCKEQEFSEFSILLDELSDKYGILFVVAAGNYLDLPRRVWPVTSVYDDRVSSPGESIRSLTVGSITHIHNNDSLSVEGTPAPYSRRGPGPLFTPKPDICHVGGGVHLPWNAGATSLSVLTPNNVLSSSFGTSFAAPLVSTMAAHTWNALTQNSTMQPDPALVKALLIHSAQLASPDYNSVERRYFGAGRPDGILSAMYDSDDSFTLVFKADLVPSLRWRKAPYPIPNSLLHEGKFRGEIVITSVYTPPLDPSAGSEYVRANVELSFGVLNGDRIQGKVPMEGDKGQNGYETAQIEHGGKWAPVKVHRKQFPQGVEGSQWALQANLTLRAFEPQPNDAIPTYIIVTLRSLDGNTSVHADGVRALSSSNWIHSNLTTTVPIST